MTAYLSYFKLRFITGLQYRISALAGVVTQIFFGLIFIMVYLAFYESGSSNAPMEFNQLVSYLWLNQCLFALIYIWYKDKDILSMIKNGNISYELCRPQELYFMWYTKILSSRLSQTLLRCVPAFIIAFLLPAPFNLSLPASGVTFVLFLITLIIGVLLVTCIVNLFHIITMFTLDEKGIVGIFFCIADIFSGLTVPLPFFPNLLLKIADFLPFRYVSDLPFRIYISNISTNIAIKGIIIQLVWIFILGTLGYILSKIALKKAIVQGG